MSTDPAPAAPAQQTAQTAQTAPTTRRLARAAGDGRPAAPVRMLHLGLGSFFRAHQAWYTEHAPDAAAWGIAAFTGTGPGVAEALTGQDCLYTLVTRAPDGDRFEVVSSVSEVHQAADHAAWLRLWADPAVVVVTVTVTEAGYARRPDGRLDADRADVAADLAALRGDPAARVVTTPARVLAGLIARRDAGAGPLTLLSCDNLPGNGAVLRAVVDDAVAAVAPDLAPWVAANVDVGTTMVDRITPATTETERADVLAATGVVDASPVPTEPFSEWVIQAVFPGGRPAWEAAGATIVDDVVPFEHRKLWLLNGAHSLMAYAGSVLGHATVAQAVADERVRAWVEQWWDEASRHVPLPADDVAAYRTALLARFANPRIQHRLAQIAAEGSAKLAVRIVPTVRAERAAGRVPTGAARALAAWTLHVRGQGAPLADARSAEVAPLGSGSLEDSVRAVLAFFGADLAADETVVAAVLAAAHEIAELAG